MEKIIISCSAEHLQYEFPKRKWYQFRKHDRIVLMRLAYAGKDVLEFDIRLCIYENMPQEELFGGSLDFFPDRNFHREFFCQIDTSYKTEIYGALLKQYQVRCYEMEHIILLDDGGNIFPELLYQLAGNKNYLSILTNEPEKYEQVLEQIAVEFGLLALVFTKQKEFIRYLKQMPQNKKTLVIAGDDDKMNSNIAKPSWGEKSKGSLLYHLPKGSFFMDFSETEVYHSIIYQKRMNFTYVSIPIFLDNTMKNRYNAVVNEGITFQVTNKKTVWRRKGNKDGRKEEYSDL